MLPGGLQSQPPESEKGRRAVARLGAETDTHRPLRELLKKRSVEMDFGDTVKMNMSRVANSLIASLKKTFGFSAEPPMCFYLEDRPLANEPYQISTPELGNICLYNGVTFKIHRQFGCLTQIEDRGGLLAAIHALKLGWGSSIGIEAMTNWRPYIDDADEVR
jgi:hypothetical protein